MADLLSIDGLRAGYGEAVVLPDMSLRLPESQVLALLGRNGTGKTTLINSIVGDYPPFRRHHQPRRPRYHADAARPAGASRHRLGAAGTQHFPFADGRGEYDGSGAAGAMDRGKSLRDVPAAEGAPQQFRQPAFRRRTADAGDRPRAHPQSEGACCWTSRPRVWPRLLSRNCSGRSAPSPVPAASVPSSSSRMRKRFWGWPTAL